jgi:hypothetical protein
MTLNRRDFLHTAAAGLAALRWNLDRGASGDDGPWTSEWDRACLNGVLNGFNRNYDPAERMIGSKRGPEYNYQSNLRDMTVHPVRDSLEYAHVLLETGGEQSKALALEILDRALALQETDPTSKWFGLWSYYMEEPLPRMNAVDFNTADFNGSTLMLILLRHPESIPAPLRARMLEAVDRACVSIRRRNITVYYTNIIAQGSFVVLAAAELTGDKELLEYGRDRMRRWAAAVDDSGSFAEYNSSAYTSFLIEIMARIRMYVHDEEAGKLGGRLESRAWDHFSAHWHVPTRQLAGPMARCYHNDIGQPLWLQKSLNNRLMLTPLEEVRRGGGSLPAGILAYRCPEQFAGRFLRLDAPRQHREVFQSGHTLIDTLNPLNENATLEPVVGTTWLTPALALGSANRSDFWNQRRPLLAYWGGTKRPLEYLQMRVMKDDYDFSSAVFHSVQEQGAVLGAVGFRNDGGDKHPLIDRVRDGAFTMRAMNVDLCFGGWQNKWRVLADGKPIQATEKELAPATRISVDTGECRIALRYWWAGFSSSDAPQPAAQSLSWHEGDGERVLRLPLFLAPAPTDVHWKNVSDAGCVFSLLMSPAVETLEAFDARVAKLHVNVETDSSGVMRCEAASVPEAGTMGIRVMRTVGTFPQMEASFHGTVRGSALPAPRLSDARILK